MTNQINRWYTVSMTVPEKVAIFFERFPEKTFEKGDILIQAGTKPPIYLLREGTVSQYDIAESGDKLILNLFKPSAFFPMSTATAEEPTPFFFEAHTKVKVRVAPADEVLQYVKNNPDVLFDLLSRVYRGTDGLLMRLARLMEGTAEGRILQELDIMQARFGSEEGIVITEAGLASQTGLARETVSRTLKKLKDQGLLELKRGRIILKDAE